MVKGEENAVLCWNCKHIAKCFPNTRPVNECPRFCFYTPLGKARIAKWLSVSNAQVYAIIEKFGEQQIVKMLKEHGYNVTCTKFDENVQFYYLGES